jgi:hypothetical protein
VTDQQRTGSQRRRTDDEAEPQDVHGGEARRERQQSAARESAYTDELLDAIDDVLRDGLGLDEAADEAEFERASESYMAGFVQKGGE